MCESAPGPLDIERIQSANVNNNISDQCYSTIYRNQNQKETMKQIKDGLFFFTFAYLFDGSQIFSSHFNSSRSFLQYKNKNQNQIRCCENKQKRNFVSCRLRSISCSGIAIGCMVVKCLNACVVVSDLPIM